MSIHLDSGLANVVLNAHLASYTVQSDYARREAEFVDMAASLGLITTKVSKGVFSRHWRPTARGLMFLETYDLVNDDEHEDYEDVTIDNRIEDSEVELPYDCQPLYADDFAVVVRT